MKIYLLILTLLSSTVYSQGLINQVNIGGNAFDFLGIYPKNTGNGYYLFGQSNSNISGDKTENSKGLEDFWLLEVDNDFNVLWDKTIGGGALDKASNALVFEDDIFLIGSSESSTSGDKTMDSFGGLDVWLLRMDENGSIVWQQQYGGDQEDMGINVIAFSDSSILLLATSSSGISGNKTVASIGYSDIWLLEVSKASGNIIQQKTIGTVNSEEVRTIKRNPHNNHVYIGASSFEGISGDKSEHGYGDMDSWIIELDDNLNIVNEKVYGGNSFEDPFNAFIFKEESIYAVGRSSSRETGNKTSTNFTPVSLPYLYTDIWLLKLNYDLSIEWDKSFGGSIDEYVTNLIEIDNGEILVVGSSLSLSGSGNKTSANYGPSKSDLWLLAIQENGEILYQESFGGSQNDYVENAIIGHDNTLVLCALSDSPISGNKTVPSWGSYDAWLGKFDLSVLSTSKISGTNFEIYPNPALNQLNVKGKITVSNYVVSDLSGKILMEGKSIENSELTLDVSSLKAGMYLLQVDGNQFKFMKQ